MSFEISPYKRIIADRSNTFSGCIYAKEGSKQGVS